ncbi:neutral invertase [Thioalkalivibrio sp. K90mix]|uniref:glycoside hydrolase 100 family protein n=1 Tax=Thioalkalivibrio sp. (strain K90mix) TaxID=396595 RepID=UPI00019599C4|nr:glycoside hydrolase 100 family protein [Thioalkalivibrio sp. K90mix]ADC72803.1 neutral invertase [Thioalkalivibrio sp. K90mix]
MNQLPPDARNPTLEAAFQLLRDAEVRYEGRIVGTVASLDTRAPAENYADCFIRDFVPSGLVYLLHDEPEVVRNFLSLILQIRDTQEEIEGHRRLPRVMPASFRVFTDENGREGLAADFGDRAIGRVAPVDSMMWWVLLARAYQNRTGDHDFIKSPDVQRGIRLILSICLQDRFEVFPTLLVPDGSFMIDRRMGVFGHPLEIQALFYGMLKASLAMLEPCDTDSEQLCEQSAIRTRQLSDYIRRYYWLDLERLNDIHRYRTEHFGHESENALNIYPESIPDWLVDWLPSESGYLVGNLGPGRMDFRFFSFGNLLAVLFGLADEQESRSIMQTFEQRFEDLIGTMPVKICYPAMSGEEWRLLTGSDPKNTPWSYHNGGNWPALLWAFTGAALRVGRPDLARSVHAVAAERLHRDDWPEYYDGRHGRLIGRRANYQQTWSATAVLVSQALLDNPETMSLFDSPEPELR